MTSAGKRHLDLLRDQEAERNEVRGYTARRMFLPAERYVIDFADDLQGWRQFDTTNDAPYFGVWTNAELRETLHYCEGDWTLCTFDNVPQFDAELREMRESYGPAPGECRVIDEHGNVVELTLREALGGDE